MSVNINLKTNIIQSYLNKSDLKDKSTIRMNKKINNTELSNTKLTETELTKTEPLECVICFEPFNEFFNKKIHCIQCNSVICLNCVKKCLKIEGTIFSCPCCKKPWDLMFIYQNIPLKIINEELKPAYAETCNTIDRTLKLQPLINEYKYLNDINTIFMNILNNYDFNKINNDNIIYLEDRTNYNLYFREYDKVESKYFYKHFDFIKSDISKEQINPIIDIYNLSNTSISFDTFIRIFAANNYIGKKFFLLFLLFNTLNNNLDNIINKYNLSLFNNLNLYGKIEDKYNNKYILTYNNIEHKYDYNALKKLSKEDIINYFHNNIFKNEQFFKDELNNNKLNLPVCKCFKGNCDGDAYKYKEQFICNKCNSVFCTKCHVEIFPKYIEYADKNGIILVDNPKYDSYTDLQKGVYDISKNNTDIKKKTMPIDNIIKNNIKHICKEEDLNTVKLMYEGAKPCPNCGELINKSGGCKDMFCVNCKTAFNWDTMKIVSENTNPLFHAWRRQQRAAAEQQNNQQQNNQHSDYNCEDLYDYKQCIEILNKIDELDNKENEHNKYILNNFAKLIELKTKPLNENKIDFYRKFYAYNLIDYDEYKLKISTLYVSKFFIDQYNSIISNTIYMINLFFHSLNKSIKKETNKNKSNKSIDDKKNINDYIIKFDLIKEIVKIHNDALCNFSKIYPNFVVNLIDKDCIPYKVKNNVKIVKEVKKLTIQKDPNVKYLLCPFYKYPKELYIKYHTIYDIFFKHHNKIPHLLDKYQFYTYFPDIYTIDDPTFLRILTDKELFNSLDKIKEEQDYDYNKDEKEEFYYDYSKQSNLILFKKYKIKKSDVDYDIILKFYNDYIIEYNTTINEFIQRYNEIINIVKSCDYNFNNCLKLKTSNYMTTELKARYNQLMKYFKYYYNYRLDDLLTELNKIDFNTDAVKNKSIFNKFAFRFASIMSCESLLMDIFIKLQS